MVKTLSEGADRQERINTKSFRMACEKREMYLFFIVTAKISRRVNFIYSRHAVDDSDKKSRMPRDTNNTNTHKNYNQTDEKDKARHFKYLSQVCLSLHPIYEGLLFS